MYSLLIWIKEAPARQGKYANIGIDTFCKDIIKYFDIVQARIHISSTETLGAQKLSKTPPPVRATGKPINFAQKPNLLRADLQQLGAGLHQSAHALLPPFACLCRAQLSPLLSCALLCFALLSCALLCFAVLCYPVLCFALLRFAHLSLSASLGFFSLSPSPFVFSNIPPQPPCKHGLARA